MNPKIDLKNIILISTNKHCWSLPLIPYIFASMG